MEPLTVCDTKEFCDTEFEADVLAAKATDKYGHEFKSYPCKNHWHIAHKDPRQSRGFGKKYWRCPVCKLIYKQKDAKNHKCIGKEFHERRN